MENTLAKAVSALMIVTAVLGFAAVLPMISWAQPTELPHFSVSPPTYTASKVGEVFNITILVNNLVSDWEAVGFEFKLGYNATILELLNVYEGPWLPPFGAPPNQGTYFISILEPDYVHVGDIELPDPYSVWHAPFPNTKPGGIETPGNFVILEFNATMKGVYPDVLTCPLHLYDTVIEDWNGTTIAEDPSEDGTYSIGFHDVAVTDVTSDRTWVYQGSSADINVTVLNKGNFDENVTVTLYYNITAHEIIGTQNVTLTPSQEQTITFTWDTTGVPYCHNYTLTATATIPVDDNPADNTLVGPDIKVRILCDTNGDGKVDIYDAVTFANYFGSQNPDADFNGDRIIDIFDAIIIARNFGKSCPP